MTTKLYPVPAPPGKEEALKIIENLTAYLIEAHMPAFESCHEGDENHQGEAPESCTYCNAIDTARQFLAAAGVDVSALTPEKEGA